MSTDHASLSQPSPEAGRRMRRGDVVHVNPGTPHPIYPDLPMGGWSGTIERIQKHKRLPLRRCWVQFSKSTTDRLHSVYEDRERRDNDPCDLWDNWVLDDRLGPGEVSPETIEHPHLPAWAEKAGDRQVRALFGLDSLDPYPDCEPATWQTWYRFLSEHLPLPRLGVQVADEDSEFYGERLTIERLLLPEDLPADYPEDEDRHGVYGEIASADETFAMPLGELKLPDDDPFDNLLRDYAHWFDAIHDDSDSDDDFDDDVPFGMNREEFERLWKSVRKATFKLGAGMTMSDETDLETAMTSFARTSPPIEEEPPDYERSEPIRAAPRTGRNDPCPCGSGKKYKKCCLRGAS